MGTDFGQDPFAVLENLLSHLSIDDLCFIAAQVEADMRKVAMADGRIMHVSKASGLSDLEIAAMHQRTKDDCPICRGERAARPGEVVRFRHLGAGKVRLESG